MNNIYKAPQADLHIGPSAEELRKRPLLVWIISIFYGFSAIITPFSFYAIKSGMLPLTIAHEQYFASLGAIDWLMNALNALVILSAAVSLFLLKRVTTKFWGISVATVMLNHIYHIFAKNWLGTVPISGQIAASFGFAVLLAVFFYVKRLAARGVLK
ncbi:MAG: hypothetical protein V4805_07525 [Pseudomonadota bacterium]